MKPSKVLINVVTAWSILIINCCVSPVQVMAWSPKKALLRQLGPVEAVGKYQIRAPIGYVIQQKYGRDGFHATLLIGPTRADRTRSAVMLAFLSGLPEYKYTLPMVFSRILASVERDHTNWKQTPIEQGTLNGLLCWRVYWRGTRIARQQHGLIYVVRNGYDYVQLSSQDYDPSQRTSLPLAEASILTFKRR